MAGKITAKHPSYTKMTALWKKSRDAICGEEAVKAAGAEYLPALSGQDDQEYQAYVKRGLFYGATGRTVRGLAGAILRKPPKVEASEKFRKTLDEIGPCRETLRQITKTVCEETIGLGRCGLLVDAAEGENRAPYIAFYTTEKIVNWRSEVVEGREKLNLVVLEEQYEDTSDPFETQVKTQYRELRLVENVYTVTVWRKKESPVAAGMAPSEPDEWVAGEAIVPKIFGGKTLTEIPFTFIGSTGTDSSPSDPPIIDLVNANLSHYRTYAQLEHGRHFTALPTAWVAGFDPKTTKLRIGSSTAWVAQDENAKCGFLEFTGQGLKHLADALAEKEKLMAVLGSRLLEERQPDAEATDTVKIRQSGEMSVLASIALSISAGLQRAVQWVASWIGSSGDSKATVVLNTDFNVGGIDPTFLQNLMLATQSGVVSWDTFFFQLQKGEIYPDGRTPEEERELIEAGLPVGGPMMGTDPGSTEDPEGDPDAPEDPPVDPERSQDPPKPSKGKTKKRK